MTIKLKIYVPDLANILALYDTIRVWRSVSGVGGPYVLITADAARPAVLLGTAPAPFDIHDETLSLKVDGGALQTYAFTSPNPIDLSLTVEELNDHLTGLTASEDPTDGIKLTSNTDGTGSILEIIGGTALAHLGFTAAQKDNGEDGHVILVAGQEIYEYNDRSGDAAYFYKVQYYNTEDGSSSDQSDAIQGNVDTIIPAGSMITGKLDVAGPDGKPVAGMRIVFYNIYTPPLAISSIWVLGRTVEVETNQAGHAEIDLVKGMVVDVTFVGTTITRRITVPSAGVDFDIMAAIAAVDDNFQIRVPAIPDAVRRAL